MAAIDIKIEGLEDVIKEFTRRGLNVQRGLELVATAGATVIERQAASNAGGAIGGAMMHATTAKTQHAVEVSVGPSKKAWYAHFVEFGTRAHRIEKYKRNLQVGERSWATRANHPGTTANAFLRPAVDMKREEAQDTMGKKVGELVER